MGGGGAHNVERGEISGGRSTSCAYTTQNVEIAGARRAISTLCRKRRDPPARLVALDVLLPYGAKRRAARPESRRARRLRHRPNPPPQCPLLTFAEAAARAPRRPQRARGRPPAARISPSPASVRSYRTVRPSRRPVTRPARRSTPRCSDTPAGLAPRRAAAAEEGVQRGGPGTPGRLPQRAEPARRVDDRRLPGRIEHRPQPGPDERGRDEQEPAAGELDLGVVGVLDLDRSSAPAHARVEIGEGGERPARREPACAVGDVLLEGCDEPLPPRRDRSFPVPRHLSAQRVEAGRRHPPARGTPSRAHGGSARPESCGRPRARPRTQVAATRAAA